jgi:hypothetical protein
VIVNHWKLVLIWVVESHQTVGQLLIRREIKTMPMLILTMRIAHYLLNLQREAVLFAIVNKHNLRTRRTK